jgi:hypothetical protein
LNFEDRLRLTAIPQPVSGTLVHYLPYCGKALPDRAR